METLKKVLIGVFVLLAFQLHSQKSYRTAFYKSYEYEKAGSYASALKELISVYNANDYFTNIRMGWLYYLNKQYTESVKYYEKSIALKPYAIEAKFGLVKPLSATENWERVKIQYQQILKIDPQNTLANYWLGVIYYNRKNYLNAVKLFEKVVNLYPLDYDSVIMLAWTKLNLGKSGEAKILFNHALTLRPNDKSSLEGLKLIK
ncbi:MAG: tetratricopeptide repeat protein [Paludibacter sp.]|nr:tetratricopeptide repeat protein [Paludibacter sp.]